MRMIKVRCPACNGDGHHYKYVDDDSRPSGRRRVEESCAECVDGAVLEAPPAKPRLGHDVAMATVIVDAYVSGSYDTPSLQLCKEAVYAHDKERGHGDPVVSISFQRNLFRCADDVRYRGAIDPRFDVGLGAWSAFYASKLEDEGGNGFPLDRPEHLERALHIVHKLNKARERLARNGADCELGRTIDALALLGVPTEIKFRTHHNVILTTEQAKQAISDGHLATGLGAKFIAEHKPAEE